MSNICEFCNMIPESCVCSADLTEPRLETELDVADNIMAIENSNIQKPYGFDDVPSVSTFFSLLDQIEEQELGPEPKWMRHNNTPELNHVFPPIPKLERQTNMPAEMKISHEDLEDLAVDLFPEEEAHFQYLKGPHSREYLRLSENLFNSDSYEKFCSTLVEMKDLYDVETSVPTDYGLPCIEYCDTCCDFSCECDKMVPCVCGALYHIDEPYQMCGNCEMAERRQDSIDQQRYPDDIRERYDSH